MSRTSGTYTGLHRRPGELLCCADRVICRTKTHTHTNTLGWVQHSGSIEKLLKAVNKEKKSCIFKLKFVIYTLSAIQESWKTCSEIIAADSQRRANTLTFQSEYPAWSEGNTGICLEERHSNVKLSSSKIIPLELGERQWEKCSIYLANVPNVS